MNDTPSKFRNRDSLSAQIEKSVLLTVIKSAENKRLVIERTLEQIEKEMPDITELNDNVIRILHDHVAAVFRDENKKIP
jgi:hypothetical protein